MAVLADPIEEKTSKTYFLTPTVVTHTGENFTKNSSFCVDLKTSVSNEEEQRRTMSVAGVATS